MSVNRDSSTSLDRHDYPNEQVVETVCHRMRSFEAVLLTMCNTSNPHLLQG